MRTTKYLVALARLHVELQKQGAQETTMAYERAMVWSEGKLGAGSPLDESWEEFSSRTSALFEQAKMFILHLGIEMEGMGIPKPGVALSRLMIGCVPRYYWGRPSAWRVGPEGEFPLILPQWRQKYAALEERITAAMEAAGIS